MDCYRHPGTTSIAACISCAQPICAECREEVAGHPMCKSCVAEASARLGAAQSPAVDHAAVATTAALSSTTGEVVAAKGPGELSPHGFQVQHGSAPGIVRRTARGMLWGIIYGQWWTLWSTLSLFMWGQGSFDMRIAAYILERGMYNAIFGFFAGTVIGATGASMSLGTNIGIGTGILLALLRMALSRNPLMLVNIFFYYVTGRFVGAGITWRVHRPVK